MTGVALRCPSCGTTQNHSGECDACYEAQVRYFCDNHNPGLWLDGTQCKACGARYGEAPKRPAAPPPAAPPPRARGPRPMPPPGEGPTEPRRARRGRVPDPPERPGPPDLFEMLRRAMAARGPARSEEDAWERPPPTMRRPRVGGCLGKLVLWAFILFVLMVLGPLFMMGSAFRFFFGG